MPGNHGSEAVPHQVPDGGKPEEITIFATLHETRRGHGLRDFASSSRPFQRVALSFRGQRSFFAVRVLPSAFRDSAPQCFAFRASAVRHSAPSASRSVPQRSGTQCSSDSRSASRAASSQKSCTRSDFRWSFIFPLSDGFRLTRWDCVESWRQSEGESEFGTRNSERSKCGPLPA